MSKFVLLGKLTLTEECEKQNEEEGCVCVRVMTI